MKNLLLLSALSVLLFASCSTTKIGVKENWIDERDVLVLIKSPNVEEWMKKVGRPVLIEMNKDTILYYYNYRPTLYAVSKSDSMSFVVTCGSNSETKPKDEQALEIWGSRYDFMQIKTVENKVQEITAVGGADKKRFILDMNGAWVTEPGSGYKVDVSGEVFIKEEMLDFYKEKSGVVTTAPVQAPVPVAAPVTTAPTTPQPAAVAPATPHAAPVAPHNPPHENVQGHDAATPSVAPQHQGGQHPQEQQAPAHAPAPAAGAHN